MPPALNGVEVAAFVVWICSIIEDRRRARGRAKFAMSETGMLANMARLIPLLFGPAFVLRIATLILQAAGVDSSVSGAFHQAYQVIVSVILIFGTVCTMQFMEALSRPLGVLVLAMEQMVLALQGMVQLHFFMIAGFSLGIYGLSIAGVYDARMPGGKTGDVRQPSLLLEPVVQIPNARHAGRGTHAAAAHLCRGDVLLEMTLCCTRSLRSSTRSRVRNHGWCQ
eukprot:785440-Prymnesium_polylepis.1